jgi:putative transposase
MAQRRPRQLELPAPCTWGGRRLGAGRKPVRDRPGPSHSCRPKHDARHPVHVTLRAGRGVPSLRSDVIFPELRRTFAASSRRAFRLLHFSVQSNHLHIIVEADSAQALTRGLQGLAVRGARAINRCSGRRGPVWNGRYHAHPLATPREVRHGLVYVLLNFRKHMRAPPAIDPCSSGPWFDGWLQSILPPAEPSPVRSPQTWLATTGWRRVGGPIDCREAPAPSSLRPESIRDEFPVEP